MTLESILLLSCRSPFLDDSKVYAPMANLYLKSYVEKHAPGIEVVLGDDTYELDNPEYWRKYDAVGVSIMTPQREQARAILTAAKKAKPDIVMIAGGPHVKHYQKEMESEAWDYLVPLDGEKSILQILHGQADCRVNASVMDKHAIMAAPRPDRTSENSRRIIRQYHYRLQEREATTMMTARGCPEQCTFCEDAMTSVKWSSMDNLRGEMDDIKSMGYGGVYIFDDLFAIAMPKVQPICDELKKRDLWYRCNGQARYFTKWGDSFAEMLASTGCKEIAFGFESGSQKILDNVKKRTTIEQNYKSVEYAKKHGIKVKGFMMLGLPGEDWFTLAETEHFIAESGMDDFQLAVYMPFKGTQIRDAMDKGEDVGLTMTVPEVSGAYGVKGGETAYEVRTSALTAPQLQAIRNHLVEKYRPKSHAPKWGDKFFEGGTA